MSHNDLDHYRSLYLKELTDSVIPFWEKHCPDHVNGGYFTCLDRDGSVYDTEKFMWMQWRIVWMFSELYVKLEQRPEWLRLAKSGYDFLTKHGRDSQGRYYFSLTADGRPTSAAHSVFSECFAVMGAAAYYRASGNVDARREAVLAFDAYLSREHAPKGEFSKDLGGKPAMKSLGFYMMKINLFAVLEDSLDDLTYREETQATYTAVLDQFWNPALKVIFENVPVDGGFDLSSMAGRHLNPGHAIEAMWFVMNLAHRMGDTDAVRRAADIVLAELEYGWDKEFGGIYYFMDALGKPHVELQWNMKLWWVHNEALIACAMGYKLTGDTRFKKCFDRVHDWSWSRFPDHEFGEWYGYLDRHGDVTHQLKGGKWKGFFHLPRMLLVCTEILTPDWEARV